MNLILRGSTRRVRLRVGRLPFPALRELLILLSSALAIASMTAKPNLNTQNTKGSSALNSPDFSLRDLYNALNDERQRRGISWSQVVQEMNGHTHPGRRALSVSTVKGIAVRTVAEADGILQMLRWLRRSPESFVPGFVAPEAKKFTLPDVPSGKVLRFDTRKLYAALDAERAKKGITWQRIAAEIGLSPATLTHLSAGGRTSFPQVMRIVMYLDRPAASFTRIAAQ